MSIRSLLTGLLAVAATAAAGADWETLLDQGVDAIERGRSEQALAPTERALASAERSLGLEHLDVARLNNILGLLYQHAGRHEQAKALHGHARRAQEAALDSSDPERADTFAALALAHRHTGRPARAARLYERALEIHRQTGPSVPDAWIRTFQARAYLSVQEKANLAAAAELLSVARWMERNYGAGDLRYADACVQAGEFLDRSGQFLDAVPCLAQSLEELDRRFGYQSPTEYLPVLLTVSSTHEAPARPPAGLTRSQRLTALVRQLLLPRYADLAQLLDDPDRRQSSSLEPNLVTRLLIQLQEQVREKRALADTSIARAHGALGARYLYTGRTERAEAHLLEALSRYRRSSGARVLEAAALSYHLANLRLAQGRLDEAGELYRRIVEVHEEVYGGPVRASGFAFEGLAIRAMLEGRRGAADEQFALALDSWSKGVGRDGSSLADDASARAQRAFDRADFTQSEGNYRLAFGLYLSTHGITNPRTRQAWQGITRALEAQGRSSLASSRGQLARHL